MATSGDFKNDLIVRGGSPSENLFLLDSVRVPGLSLFGSQNSSGGFFGLLNQNLIKDIDFYTGGFPAYYGDKLSSVTRIGLREGDRTRLSGRLNLSLLGPTGTIEGPLPGGAGSWIVSGRKDYLGVIPSSLTQGLMAVPDVADAQTKIIVDLSSRLQLSLLGLGAALKAILGPSGIACLTLSRTRSLYDYAETRGSKGRLEIYDKRYHNYPLDPTNPYLTLANQGGNLVPTFFGSRLVGAGTGYARGVEVSIRQAPSGKLSWLVDYSYAVVKFKALDGVLRNGDFDFRHILNAVATYRLSGTFEVSVKWRYLGGQPYTPFDMSLTTAKNSAYFDMTRINELRYPAYHRLDIRFEKRFIFKVWSLDVYLDVQNVYNRKNVYYNYWDDGMERTVYLLPILPFFGLQAGF